MSQEIPPVGLAKVLHRLGFVLVVLGIISLLGRSTVSKHSQTSYSTQQGTSSNLVFQEQQRKEQEQRKAEEKVAFQKLCLATVPGTSYIGTIARGDMRCRLHLVFTEQKGVLIRAEVTCPDKPKEKQTFTGELVSNSQLKKDSNVVYPIVMSPTGGSNWAATGDVLWFFRGSEGSLKLRLTDAGLEGETGGWQFGGFTIRLQREAMTYLWQAETAFRPDIRDYDKAIADCSKAIELDPTLAEAYSYRGRAFNEKGDFGKGIADCSKAIELDPNDYDAYHNRGFSYYGKKDYDKAITDWSKVIELRPDFSIPYEYRGLAYNAKRDYDKAIADWSKAMELDPREGLLYKYRCCAYITKGDYDKAWADAKKCQTLGRTVDQTDMEELRKASGRSE